VRLRRTQAIEDEFILWMPQEVQRRNSKLNEQERSRLNKKQIYVYDKERKGVKQLQQHLASRDGNLQLQQLLITHRPAIFTELGLDLLGLSRGEKKRSVFDYLAQQLKKDCVNTIRCLEGHNYDATHPPLIKCFDHHCHATFTTEQQYHNHLQSSVSDSTGTLHPAAGLSADRCSTMFHLMLKHSKRQEALRGYWAIQYGWSGLVNLLDLYLSIQDWKKVSTQSVAYYTKAMSIYDMYCSADGARRVALQAFPGIDSLHATIQHLKEHNITSYVGFYHSTHARPGLVRKYVLGWDGVSYTHFTVDYILRADVFQALELYCFHTMFQAALGDIEGLLHVTGYKQSLAMEAECKRSDLRNDYRLYREGLIRAWTKRYMHQAVLVGVKADEMVACLLDQEVQRLYIQAEKNAVKEAVTLVRYHQQVEYEAKMLIGDEAVAWAEHDVLEYIYTHYATTLLAAMWEVTDYRKGMLQYAGLLIANLKKKSHADNGNAVARKAERDWMDQFMRTAFAEERQPLLLPKLEAAITIQRQVRRMLSRKRVKIAFARRYKKYFDERYQSYYYYDVQTGQSSWTPPLLFKALYPKASW
jgi:hypothetical protein